MVMATDADINIEHRLTEVDARAQSNTKRLNEHDEILKSNTEMVGAIKELATEVIIQNFDWTHPVQQYETAERNQLPKLLTEAVRLVEKESQSAGAN